MRLSGRGSFVAVFCFWLVICLPMATAAVVAALDAFADGHLHWGMGNRFDWRRGLIPITLHGLEAYVMGVGLILFAWFLVFLRARGVTVRAAAVPEGMLGTVHLAWYDPDNSIANVPATPPANVGHGLRDNAASLVAAGDPLPGFTLRFTTEGPSPTSDAIQKAYLAIEDARYGDNFIVAVHPHSGIAETFEFRENQSQELVLMRPANTGLWHELPDDDDPADDPADGVQDHRTSVLTIIPSVDIDTDSDNTGTINRSDHEEEVENQANEPGKIVLLNNDDDNGNNQSDMDEVDASGNPLVYSQPDDDLTQVILDFGLVSYDGLDGCALRLTASDGLRIWGDQLRNLPDGATVQGTG